MYKSLGIQWRKDSELWKAAIQINSNRHNEIGGLKRWVSESWAERMADSPCQYPGSEAGLAMTPPHPYFSLVPGKHYYPTQPRDPFNTAPQLPTNNLTQLTHEIESFCQSGFRVWCSPKRLKYSILSTSKKRKKGKSASYTVALEQHRFGLHRSNYMWIFSINTVNISSLMIFLITFYLLLLYCQNITYNTCNIQSMLIYCICY